MTIDKIKKLTFNLIESKDIPWEIMEIRENEKFIIVYINYVNEDGSLGVELWFNPPLYKIDKKDNKVERIYMIDNWANEWANSKVIYQRKMSLKEAECILKRTETYRFYEINKIYESLDYFKFIISFKTFDLKKIIVFDRNNNTYFEINEANYCIINGIDFKEV